MIFLPKSLKAYGSAGFNASLKQELEQLDPRQLPLQQGLSSSSYALDEKITAIVISVADEPDFVHAKLGIFFSGIIAGCSCADDPTPVEPQTEYCEVRLAIDKTTAEASVALIED